MVRVGLTGKVRLEQRPKGSEGLWPAARGDKAFPVERTTKVIGQESARLFLKNNRKATVAGEE